MAELMPAAQDTEAAREYRRRVLELDPYAEFAQGVEFNTVTVPDGAVTVQRLEYAGGSSPPDLAQGLSLAAEAESQEATHVPPSWLSGARAQAAEQPSLMGAR